MGTSESLQHSACTPSREQTTFAACMAYSTGILWSSCTRIVAMSARCVKFAQCVCFVAFEHWQHTVRCTRSVGQVSQLLMDGWFGVHGDGICMYDVCKVYSACCILYTSLSRATSLLIGAWMAHDIAACSMGQHTVYSVFRDQPACVIFAMHGVCAVYGV